MREISYNGDVIALIFDEKLEDGTIPLTSPELPLQVIGLKHPRGKVWPLHIHEPKKRTTDYLLEIFFLLSGRARVEIVDSGKVLASVELKNGEGILVLRGAVKVEALENVKALEFKNGPFMEDKIIVKNEV